jgi:hypothetical protein
MFRGIKVCRMCERLLSDNETPVNADPISQPPLAQPNYTQNTPPVFPREFPTNNTYSSANANFNHQPPISPPYRSANDEQVSILEFISNLSIISKTILGIVVSMLLFAGVLKIFMSLDVSVQHVPVPVAVDGNLQPQKRWFSSWFRKEPTGDEILEKFEAVTYAKDKNPVSETISVKGKLQFLPPEFSEPNGLLQIKEKGGFETKSDNIYQNYTGRKSNYLTPANVGQIPLWNMNSDFDISLKTPNKILMKMSFEPKEKKVGVQQKFYVDVGFDGVSTWSFSKIYDNGTVRTEEQNVKDVSNFGNVGLDGISMTFLRKMYRQTELKGEETILNRKAYVVETIDMQGDVSTLYFDVETGLVVKVLEKKETETVFILDYRMFNGILYPSKMVYKVAEKEWMMFEISEITPNVTFEDSIFQRLSYQRNN